MLWRERQAVRRQLAGGLGAVAGKMGKVFEMIKYLLAPYGMIRQNSQRDSPSRSIFHLGSVSYTYDIGGYDVTDSQYVTFLNDVDANGRSREAT
jgi:hypothetical protein